MPTGDKRGKIPKKKNAMIFMLQIFAFLIVIFIWDVLTSLNDADV